MKKLIIAVASALGFAFYANAADEAPTPIGSTFTAEGLTAGELLDVSQDDNGDTDGYRYWTAAGEATGEATIDSTVTAYDNENNVKPEVDDVPGDVGLGANFLAIDQSDVLNRHFLSQDANNGSVDIGNGLYIDTMVQFTAADTAPETTTGDKLIVWLQEVEAAEDTEPATNLVVTAGYYDNGVLKRKDYVISDITVNPNEWYRLTIRAISDIGNGTAGFIVYINKNPVAVGKNVFGTTAGGDEITVGGAETALIEAGAVFPSLMGPDSNAPKKLTSVGFKGTGKIDNLSLSDANPDFIQLNNNYTVSWYEGVVSFTYKIEGENESVSISTADYTAEKKYPINLGAAWPTITFTEIVYADGYGYVATEGGIIANKPITTGADNNTGKLGAAQMFFAVGDNKYPTIDEAIDAANGNPIKLNQDIVVSSDYDVLMITDDIVLDLAGKKIYSKNYEGSPVVLDAGATLRVIDSEGDGKIIGSDNGDNGYNDSIYMYDGGGHVIIGSAAADIADKGATILGEINTNDPDGVAAYSILVVKGKMNWDPTKPNYVDSGSAVTGPVDGLYTVAPNGDEPSVVYVAQIGDKQYETLAEAITAATNDGAATTVVLLADVTVAEKLTVPEGDVIDFNGKTFAGALDGTFKVNGGKYSTAVKNLIAPANAPYTTTDAVITMSDWQEVVMPQGMATTPSVYTATKLTINSGTVTLGESTYTVPGQTLTVEAGAKFVVPANLAIYFVGSAVIEGTVEQTGTIVLAAANASIKAAEGLNITAGVANMKVVYSNGVYALEEDSGEDPGDITWDDVDEIGDVELPGELIAGSVDIDKLKKYANDNGLTVADVATMDPVKFALGLAPTAADAAVDAAKENFKVTISFDADGNPVVDMQGDENFNVTPVVQGAAEVNGTYTDGVGNDANGKKKQFFKAVIKFND